MTELEQYQDSAQQLEYLSEESQEYGYSGIIDLFRDSPELFDQIASEYRESHTDDSYI